MQQKYAQQQIIMGVDPGTNVLGYSVILSDKNTIKILTNGILHLQKIENHFYKLRSIHETLSGLIGQFNPSVLAIEAPFFGRNVQSMLKLGRAQGAAILAAASFDLEIIEYSPRKIKQSITGKGNASKEQVALMLKSLLQMPGLPEYFDETDALAAAVCHHNCRSGMQLKKPSFSSWKDYVKANADKIVRT